MKTLKFSLLAAAVAVTGCSSIPSIGPDYDEPQFDIPDYVLPDAGLPTTNLTATCEYAPAATDDDDRVVITDDVIDKWWLRFDDPLLADLVEGALTNNLSYLRTIKRLEQSEWEWLGSYAAFMPKFSVGADWNRNWLHERTQQAGGARQDYNYSAAVLDGSWELDIFGGSRRRAEAAYAMAQAAGWGVADAWLSLTTQIGMRYIALRTVQESIAVSRTNLVLQTETYDILKSRLDSGIGDELAVNQCAYVVEQTRASIPGLLAREDELKNELAVLAGEVPGAFDETLAPVAEPRDWLLAPQKVASLPLDLLRARPDVKAAERQLAAATAEIGVAKAMWLPKLFINGQIGFNTPTSKSLFSKASFFAAIGPSVSWPIFQGGAIYANVKATEAKMEAAALDYALALENAYADVRNSYSAYTQEYHRYQSLQSAVKAATDAVTISKDLYKNGLRDFNNVLDAQRSRLQLEDELVASRGQITIKLIQLYRSLGGGLSRQR